jgi:hypothetical protein
VQKSVFFVVFFRIHMLPTFLNETYTRIPDMYPAGQIRLRL